MDDRLAKSTAIDISKYDCVVVGAGLAGGVLARRLAEEEDKRVLVLDRRDHIGGNAYDQIDEHGIRVQRYGPHTFHTDSEEVYDFLCRFCTPQPQHLRCEAVIDGVSTPSPFNFKTIDQLYPAQEAERLKEALLRYYSGREEVTVLEMLQAADTSIRGYAQMLFEKDYRPYTAKQWNLDPAKIDPSVLNRVPIVLSYRDTYFHDRFEFMPEEGFEALFQRLLSHPNIHVELGIDALAHMEIREDQNCILFDGSPVQLIYTGAIDELFSCRFGVLPYRSLEFRFESYETDSFQDVPIVAHPQAEGYTRITEYTKLPVQQSCGWTTVAYEYPLRGGTSEHEPYYPVLTSESRFIYDRYLAYAASFRNLILCGRLADFKYYNMDQVILRAFDVFKSMEAQR